MSTSAGTRGQVCGYFAIVATASALAGCGAGGLSGQPGCQADGKCDAGAGGVPSAGGVPVNSGGSIASAGGASGGSIPVPSTGGVPASSGGSKPIPSTGGVPASSGGSIPIPSTGGVPASSGGSSPIPSTGGVASSGGTPDSALDATAFGEKYRFASGELPGWKQDTAPDSYSVYTADELVQAIDGAAGVYQDMGCQVSVHQDLVGLFPQNATVWVYDFVTAAHANLMFKWKQADSAATTVIPGYDPTVAIGSPSIVGINAIAHFNGLYVEVTVSGLGDQTSTCSACPVVARFLDVLRAKALGIQGDAGVPDGGSVKPGPDAGSVSVVKATPSSVNFGAVNVGDVSPPRAVTVVVVGTPVLITPSLTGPGFILDSATTCGSAALQTCTISVAFAPTGVGGASGVLTLVPGILVSLSGTGLSTPPPSLTLSSSVLPPTIQVNQSVPLFVTVTTAGLLTDLSCLPSGPDLTNDPVATNCTAVLAADASCVYAYIFKASTAGAKVDRIVCSSPSLGIVKTVDVTPIVVTPAALSISPTTGSFSTGVGQTSAPIVFILANAGGSTSGTLSAPVLAGANADQFAITDNKCLVPLASVATCPITVVFKPTAAGTKTAFLTVTDATPGSTPVTANLTGIAAL